VVGIGNTTCPTSAKSLHTNARRARKGEKWRDMGGMEKHDPACAQACVSGVAVRWLPRLRPSDVGVVGQHHGNRRHTSFCLAETPDLNQIADASVQIGAPASTQERKRELIRM
jgi:hypothetical protein